MDEVMYIKFMVMICKLQLTSFIIIYLYKKEREMTGLTQLKPTYIS